MMPSRSFALKAQMKPSTVFVFGLSLMVASARRSCARVSGEYGFVDLDVVVERDVLLGGDVGRAREVDVVGSECAASDRGAP
jgi:hypothetical protein